MAREEAKHLLGILFDWELVQPPTPQQLPSGYRDSMTQRTEKAAVKQGREAGLVREEKGKRSLSSDLGQGRKAEGNSRSTATPWKEKDHTHTIGNVLLAFK